MKVGLSTRLWGMNYLPLNEIIKVAEYLGVDGIEFSQTSHFFDRQFRECLYEELSAASLLLVGIESGSLFERIKFLDSHEAEFLLIKEWPIKQRKATLGQHRLVVQNRCYVSEEWGSGFRAILDSDESIGLALDIAHMSFTGERFDEIFDEYRDRIECVYLHDWQPALGGDITSFARTFSSPTDYLGADSVLRKLKKSGYDKWVVLKFPAAPPLSREAIVESSRMWMRRNGLVEEDTAVSLPIFEPEGTGSQNYIHNFSISDADFFRDQAARFSQLAGAQAAVILACSTDQTCAFIRGASPFVLSKFHSATIMLEESLTGVAVSRGGLFTRFDLRSPHPARKYGSRNLHDTDPDLAELDTLIAIPVFTQGSQTHVSHVLLLYFASTPIENPPWITKISGELARDIWIWQRLVSQRHSEIIQYETRNAQNAHTFCELMIDYIQECIPVEGVSIFLLDHTHAQLNLKASTGIKWTCTSEMEGYYKAKEGVTSDCWQSNRTIVLHSGNKKYKRLGKSYEIVNSSQHWAYVFTPIRSKNRGTIGVVRCRNKEGELGPFFSIDDVSLLNAICNSVAEKLGALLDTEHKFQDIQTITHELKNPVVALRENAASLRRLEYLDGLFEKTSILCTRNELGHLEPEDVFIHPEDDVRDQLTAWVEYLDGVIDNVDYVGDWYTGRTRFRPHQLSTTFLVDDVIVPAQEQVKVLMMERKFSRHHVEIKSFRGIPPLNVDKGQFRQVFFNLFSNAVKYAWDDPKAFWISVEPEKGEKGIFIHFSDQGRGIDPRDKDRIFLHGVRGRDIKAEELGKSKYGRGVGLWVVREIVGSHGGNVAITSNNNPTTISLFLPYSIRAKRNRDG